MLSDCQNDIIDRFGGLETMIELCLTNPQFSTDTYKQQFDSFKSLMESQNINIGNNDFESDDNHVTIKYNDQVSHKEQAIIVDSHKKNHQDSHAMILNEKTEDKNYKQKHLRKVDLISIH